MTRRHDAVFDDVLKGLGAPKSPAPGDAEDRGAARFLRRANTLAETAAGERQEKVLRLVDPATCRMWERHNRAYAFLSEATCRDLIDGLISQGRQEFPAIVRRLPSGSSHDYEVICGARRHFAVTWLRANTYPDFRYLIEERDLSDEEAFRLADIENRDRADISDWERAKDYASAVELYYGGSQKRMAERLEVSPAWLSRYLDLARLPDWLVASFPSPAELKEAHARVLKPLAAQDATRTLLAEIAAGIVREREAGASIAAAAVMKRLRAAAAPVKSRKATVAAVWENEGGAVRLRKKGRALALEFDSQVTDEALRAALEAYLASRGKRHEG